LTRPDFGPIYTGRAGLARKGETGYTFEPGPQAGGWRADGLARGLFSICYIFSPKSDFNKIIATKTTLQYII